jgi:hypothetical protein
MDDALKTLRVKDIQVFVRNNGRNFNDLVFAEIKPGHLRSERETTRHNTSQSIQTNRDSAGSESDILNRVPLSGRKWNVRG